MSINAYTAPSIDSGKAPLVLPKQDRPQSLKPGANVLNKPGVGAKDVLGAKAELRITGIERLGSGPVDAGQVVPVRVWISNAGRVSATVTVGNTSSNGSINRSNTTSDIPPRGRGSVRLDIPIEIGLIRGNEFKTSVAILDAYKRTGGWLDQMWRDSNTDDNARTVSYTVTASVYRVRVTIRDFRVQDDCDSGSEPGEWELTFGAAAANHAFPFTIGGLPAEFGATTASAGALYSRDARLRSNRNYRFTAQMNVNSVGRNQMLAIYLKGKEYDEPLGVDVYCWTAGGAWLTPNQWQRGGHFSATDDKNLITFNFHVSARPVTVR